MKIYVFGNQDLDYDNVPIRILPELQKIFPHITFELKDPNEELEVEDNLTIIDAVHGIETATIFTDLKQFKSAPHISMHDFDLYSKLAFMQKLGKLRQFKIIGIPKNYDDKDAIQSIKDLII